MKNLILTVLLAFLIGFVVNAQTDNPNAPTIEFEKEVHDYGTIEQGDDGNCVFVFTNNGKEPLILSDVKSSCGCTVPKWPSEPIGPGKSNEIKVKYNTKRLGKINKTVTVYSNAGTPVKTIKITGNVLEKKAAPATDDNSAAPRAN